MFFISFPDLNDSTFLIYLYVFIFLHIPGAAAALRSARARGSEDEARSGLD